MGFQKLWYSYLPIVLFHKEAGLLHSPLTGGDCFLLEMAQGGLAFGAHQQGVLDLVNIEMSCLAWWGRGEFGDSRLKSGTVTFGWCPIPILTYLVWNGNRTPREQPSLCQFYGLSGSGQVRTREEKKHSLQFSIWSIMKLEAGEPQEMESSPSGSGHSHSLH